MSQEDLQQSLKLLYATYKVHYSTLNLLLQEYSPIVITAITFASADRSLAGHYGRVVSYMLAEDVEIMVFLLLFRIRREIFEAPNQIIS